MLKGNKVRLRAVEPEDLDLMYLVENDTELWSCGHNTVPFSYYALKQYLSENTNDLYRDRQLRFVIETTEGIGVGFLDFMHFDPFHLRAEVGIVVLAEQQRRGIATEALQLLKALRLFLQPLLFVSSRSYHRNLHYLPLVLHKIHKISTIFELG